VAGENTRPAKSGYDKLPPPSGYDKLPLPRGYDKLPLPRGYDKLPPPSGYDKLPISVEHRANPLNLTKPVVSANNVANSNQTVGSKKTFKIIDQAKNAKRVFTKAIVNVFSHKNKKVKTIEHQGGLVEKEPGSNTYLPSETGVLGKFLGGGISSSVFLDSTNPEYVHKLVSLTWIKGEMKPDSDQSPDNTVTDQMAGYEMLNRFKQTHQGKTLGKLFDVAERSDVSIFKVKVKVSKPGVMPEQFDEKLFAHTRERNISSAVFLKDAVGRGYRIMGDDKLPVTATNAEERISLRIKERRRLEALQEGHQLKLSEIHVGQDEIGKGLTHAEEATLNAVIRGLNHQGIVWQDHKLQNLDIVTDLSSPTGHRVIFFDYDGFRPVQGEDRATRAKTARDLQLKYDWDDRKTPERGEEIQTFDYTAFGLNHTQSVSTPGANQHRTLLSDFDGLTDQAFNTQVMPQVLRGRSHVIEFE
jgi:hypothetical protein